MPLARDLVVARHRETSIMGRLADAGYVLARQESTLCGEKYVYWEGTRQVWRGTTAMGPSLLSARLALRTAGRLEERSRRLLKQAVQQGRSE